ncbi:hypothetical protein C8F01DRAFT_85580 [Mycena amicta]|nr:hypothetical protein C8F01DRAFT_85580 [Mycena amicta]
MKAIGIMFAFTALALAAPIPEIVLGAVVVRDLNPELAAAIALDIGSGGISVDAANVGWTVDGSNSGWTVNGNNYSWHIYGAEPTGAAS